MDDGAENNRGDHHFDQLDEAIAERLQRLAEFGKEPADQNSDGDSDQHLEVEDPIPARPRRRRRERMLFRVLRRVWCGGVHAAHSAWALCSAPARNGRGPTVTWLFHIRFVQSKSRAEWMRLSADSSSLHCSIPTCAHPEYILGSLWRGRRPVLTQRTHRTQREQSRRSSPP